MVCQKFMIAIIINIHANPENRHPLISEPLLQLYERGHLLYAWRAPGGPEIQHDNFAGKITQFDFVIGILHDEIGSRGANAWGTRTAVTTDQKNKANG